MSVPETLLEVQQSATEGYKPLIDYGEWRVAILRYIDELLPGNISRMQRHDETDEVFVLLKGRCILFLGAGKNQVTDIFAEDMEPLKLYNVKRSAWHTHTLSKEATVLIVENRETTKMNSPEIELSAEQRQELQGLADRLWG